MALVFVVGCNNTSNTNLDLESSTSSSGNIEKYDLLKVYSFLESEPTEEDKQILSLNLEDGDCELRKLSTAVLFKYDQGYKNNLYEEFAVRDSNEINQGIYNYESSDYVVKSIEEIEKEEPYSSRQELTLLKLFCDLQDKNIWIKIEEDPGKLSMARFFRGAFLEKVLGFELDTVELANDIDKLNP